MRKLLAYLLIVVLGAQIAHGSGKAEAKQHTAVLIGINDYSPDGGQVSSKSWRDSIPSLTGCENDVAAMRDVLINVYDWNPSDIKVLATRATSAGKTLKADRPTRKAIIDALADLASSAKENPGETVLFYYSGHGGVVYNSKSTKNGSNESNTIIPADSLEGQEDIPDKVLADGFNLILKNGGKVTAIFDSCFSGTITRGPTPVGRVVKAGPPVKVEVLNKKVDIDLPDLPNGDLPWQNGCLTLSACRYYEPAQEMEADSQDPAHGAFTKALVATILQDSGRISVENLIFETRAKMKSYNCDQEPVIECKPGRENLDIFGNEPLDASDVKLIPISSDRSGNTVDLQGGMDFGIWKGTKLKAIVGSRTAYAEVDDDPAISECTATFKSGDLAAFQKTSSFTIDGWIPDQFPGVKLYIPRSNLTASALLEIASQLSPVVPSGSLVYDPIESNASVQLGFFGGKWRVSKTTKKETISTSLPSEPQLSDLKKAVSPDDKVFLGMPLVVDLSNQLHFQTGPSSMIEEVSDPGQANYELIGRVKDGKLQYAWVAPGASDTSDSDQKLPAGQTSFASIPDGMPKETLWVEAGSDAPRDIEFNAEKLAQLKNWMALTANQASSGDASQFPYQLEIRDSSTHLPIQAGVIGHAGSAKPYPTYDIYLVPKKDLPATDQPQDRYVYVMDIDEKWRGILVYPSDGSSGAIISPKASDMQKGLLLVPALDFIAPFGQERFIMVTSVVPLPAGSLFNFEGFRGQTRGSAASPLEQLLQEASSGTRSPHQSLSDWSVFKLTITSSLPSAVGTKGGNK